MTDKISDFEVIQCLDVSLAEKLIIYANQLEETNSDVALRESDFVDRLLASDAGSQAPKDGSILPEFLLPDDDGSLLSSVDLLRSGPLIVSFNRGHWCPFCRLELLALAEVYPEIKQHGGELVSIMPESAESVGLLRENYQIPFRILTDIDNGYALECNLMVSFGDALREIFLKIGTNLSKFQNNNAWFVPIPATFIIGMDGCIITRFVDVDFRHRMAPDVILDRLNQIT